MSIKRNVVVPKNEHQLYASLAHAITPAGADLSAFNGEDVFRMAWNNGITALLAQGVTQGRVSVTDAKLTDRLATAARDQAGIDLVLNLNTQKLLNRFAEAGIEALLLKGTPIALLHYPHSWLRIRGDSDFYIRERDKLAAGELLMSEGFSVTGLGHRRHSSKQFVAQRAAFQEISNHFDIHWRLSNRTLFRNTLTFEECNENRQPVPELGPNAFTLCDTDLLLHACLHRVAHGRNTERDRLLWLYDIHLLFHALKDRNSFIRKALDKQIGALCADAVRTSELLFAEEESSEETRYCLDELERNARHEPTARLLNASKLRWAWADMVALESMRERVGFARELLIGR